MSEVLIRAYEKAQNTKVIVNVSPKRITMEMMDIAMLWPDFTGRITQYHKKLGEKRSFNIVLSEEMLDVIRQLEHDRGIKFRVHEHDMYSDLDVERGATQQKVYYINVKVNMDVEYPPAITLFTEVQDPKTNTVERTRNTLLGDQINVLDRATIVTADCQLNIYQSDPDSPFVSAYLRKLNVQQEIQKEFGGRWDGWENVTDDDPFSDTDESVGNGLPFDVNIATGDTEK